MPAPAVIPAPIAYIKVVAVKKLVVEFWAGPGGRSQGLHCLCLAFPSRDPACSSLSARGN